MANPSEKNEGNIDLASIIAEAADQYQAYVELGELASILHDNAPQDSYQRDFSHPLNLQIDG